MSEATTQEKTWKFPKQFWIANSVELLERAAYYAVFIAITLYLSRIVGFNDIEAAWLSGFFSAGLYFLPPFTGAFADKIGFRKAIILAFSLLTIGYFTLGIAPYKSTVIPALIVLMFGGSFIKSIITGTVAVTTNQATRARGYSIFYAIVNVGAFSGKTFAKPLRTGLGLEYINYYAALMTFIAIIVCVIFFKNMESPGTAKSFKQVVQAFFKLLTKVRLVVLIFIVTGFWMIQHQLYATMPKYVLRNVGEGAAPEWYANVNPAIVMLFVMLITQLMSKVKAVTSMTIGMFIMPFSAFAMSMSPFLQKWTGGDASIFGVNLHPVALAMVIGIVFQGLAECFISPRFLEYFSLQAPEGEEGLYLGFSHLHSFLAAILGFGLSGYLLAEYCPDPRIFAPFLQLNVMHNIYVPVDQLKLVYSNGHVIWYYFAAIGFTAGVALIIFNLVTKRIDARKEALEKA